MFFFLEHCLSKTQVNRNDMSVFNKQRLRPPATRTHGLGITHPYGNGMNIAKYLILPNSDIIKGPIQFILFPVVALLAIPY